MYATLRRTDIDTLEEAFYSASCFAGSAKGRCVTILTAVTPENTEVYEVLDGRVTQPWRKDQPNGIVYRPSYVVEASCP